MHGTHDEKSSMDSALLCNDASQKWTVQKFGGTSVGKFANKIAEDIVK